MTSAARRWRSQGSKARISRQLAVRLMARTLSHSLGSVRDGRQRAEPAALRTSTSSRPQRAPTASASRSMASLSGKVDRRHGGGAAGGVDALFDLDQTGLLAAGQDDMVAGGGERFGGGGADAAAGAGDERDLSVTVMVCAFIVIPAKLRMHLPRRPRRPARDGSPPAGMTYAQSSSPPAGPAGRALRHLPDRSGGSDNRR